MQIDKTITEDSLVWQVESLYCFPVLSPISSGSLKPLVAEHHEHLRGLLSILLPHFLLLVIESLELIHYLV